MNTSLCLRACSPSRGDDDDDCDDEDDDDNDYRDDANDMW